MLLNKVRYFFNFLPFRLNFIVFVLVAGIAFYWLRENYISTETSFGFLVAETGMMILMLAALLVAISFLTTFLSWLYFIAYRKEPALVYLGKDIKEVAGWVPLEV